jgi:nitrogen regulatory protein PII
VIFKTILRVIQEKTNFKDMEPAIKIVIVTERIIVDEVTTLIEQCGASGYTLSPAGGKGSRGIRSSERQALNDVEANIKIEAVVTDQKIAEDIAKQVAEEYLSNYSGIIFLEDVKIIRPEKFLKD